VARSKDKLEHDGSSKKYDKIINMKFINDVSSADKNVKILKLKDVIRFKFRLFHIYV